MAGFDSDDREACVTALRASAGDAFCSAVDLAALAPAHVAALAELARRLESRPDVERWQVGVILAELAGAPERSAQLAASGEDLAGPVGELLAAGLERVIRDAVPAVAAAIGADVGLDRTATTNAVVADLCAGKRGQEIATALLGRVRASPQEYLADFETWVARTGAKTFAALRPQLMAALPPGCVLDETACVQTLQTLVRATPSVQETAQAFGEQFRGKPEIFVQGYDDHLRRQAQAVYEQLQPGLQAQAPELPIDGHACVETLLELMRARTPPAKLVETFAARLRAQPRRFFQGYDQWLEKQASALCAQIMVQLAKQLPAGVVLKHPACLALVRQLLAENHSPTTLVPRFLEVFQANVRDYVEPPAPRPSYGGGRSFFSSGGPRGPTSSSGREAT